MCKAAGKRYGKYSENQQTQEFIAKLAEDLRCPNSDLLISVVGKGKEQGTWVHEDLAYHLAMWCSPVFQLWCIRQIKALTKGKPIHREIAEFYVEANGLLPSVNRLAELLNSHATENRMRHDETLTRFDRVEKTHADFQNEVYHRFDQIQSRRNLTKKTKADHHKIIARSYGGLCPCCANTKIVGDDGLKTTDLEWEHWISKSQSELSQTWSVCKACNNDLKRHDFKAEAETCFKTYQKRRLQWQNRAGVVRCFPGMEDAK
jgi:hypothetical protein